MFFELDVNPFGPVHVNEYGPTFGVMVMTIAPLKGATQFVLFDIASAALNTGVVTPTAMEEVTKQPDTLSVTVTS